MTTMGLKSYNRIREKLWLIFKATRQHARNLATFALIYKSSCLAMKSTNNGKERSLDTFLAGLIGGYYVFGRSKSSVNQQIVIYVFARVVLATAALAFQPPGDNALIGGRYGGRGGIGFAGNMLGLSEESRQKVRRNAWPVFASLSWASVMWLFRYYPEMLQPSLKSSMTYMYVFLFLIFSCFHLPRTPSCLPFLRHQKHIGQHLTDAFDPCSDTTMRIIGILYATFFFITHDSLIRAQISSCTYDLKTPSFTETCYRVFA